MTVPSVADNTDVNPRASSESSPRRGCARTSLSLYKLYVIEKWEACEPQVCATQAQVRVDGRDLRLRSADAHRTSLALPAREARGGPRQAANSDRAGSVVVRTKHALAVRAAVRTDELGASRVALVGGVVLAQ